MKAKSSSFFLFTLLGFCLLFETASLFAGKYSQDFNSSAVGATSFGDGSQFFSSHAGTAGAVQDATYKELQLTTNGTQSTYSAFLLPDLDPDTPVYAFSAKWNMELNANFPDGADGFSFNFGQLGTVNLTNHNVALESGYSTGICFSVQTYFGNSPGFYVRVNNTTNAFTAYTPATQWGANNTKRHFVEVDWHYLKGLTVRLNHQSVFTDVSTAGFLPRAGDRFAWAARTGGSAEKLRLDNIVVRTGGNLMAMGAAYYGYASDYGNAYDAFDNNDSTYFPLSTATGWINRVNDPFPIVVEAYALTSAPGTAPGGSASDPKAWFFEGTIDYYDWSLVGDSRTNVFAGRQQTSCWLATNPTSCNAYQLRVTANNGHSNTCFGDLRYYWFQAVEGRPSVTTLAARNVFDATTTLRGIVNPNHSNTTAWFQWGSTTNYGNVTAAQNLGSGVNAVNVSAQITNLTVGATYQYRVAASNSYGIMYGTNVSFVPLALKQIFDTTLPGDSVFGTSHQSPINQDSTKAIDGTANSKYLNLDEQNSGFTVFPSATLFPVRALTLISADDEPPRDPASFRLEGSMDGVNFTQVASNAVPAFPARFSVQTLSFTNSIAYEVYRLTFPTVLNSAAANSMQIAEVELLPYGEITSPQDIVTLKAPAGSFIEDGASKLVDRQLAGTQRLQITGLPEANADTVVEIAPAIGGSVLKGFELIGSDNGDRYPTSLTIAGSVNGSNFTALASVALTFPTAVFQLEDFSLFTNTTPYLYYRVTLGRPFAGDILSVSELRLFGEPTVVASQPVVGTLPAINIGTTSATLKGQVNPNSLATKAWLQYGATTNYGNVSAMQNLPATNAVFDISVALSGLTPGGYHYRVVASNALGVAFGNDVAFATLGSAPTVETRPLSTINSSTAWLEGRIIPNYLPTIGWFEWGLTTNYGLASVPEYMGTSTDWVYHEGSISNLTADTVYHFRTVASNALGIRFSADSSFLTKTSPPPQLWELYADRISTNAATLNAVFELYNLPATVRFEYGPNLSYGNTTPVQTIAATDERRTISAAISGLEPDQNYYFRVIIQNSVATNVSSRASFVTREIALPIVYVNGAWSGTPDGNDPDGAGPATKFGFDAFTSIAGAISNVVEDGVVSVASGTYSESDYIHIKHGLSIVGAGPGNTIISGLNHHQVLYIDSEMSVGTVRLSGLTIREGSDSYGGAIHNNFIGELVVENCHFIGNVATGGGGGAIFNENGRLTAVNCLFATNSAVGNDGGAVLNYDYFQMTLINCTFTENAAEGNGGAVTLYAGNYDRIINCTFSGNKAGDHGGALNAEDKVTIWNSTFTGNLANSDGDAYGEGGGIYRSADYPMYITNSIIAGNTAGTSGLPSGIAGYYSSDIRSIIVHSLIDDPATAYGAVHGVQGNIVGDGVGGVLPVASVLAPLANNGGLTATHLLASGSPAKDAGLNTGLPLDLLDLDGDGNKTNEFLPFDQRGTGYARVVGTSVDMGAIEMTATSLPSLTIQQSINQLVLRWPTTGFVLQQNTNLGSASWVNATNSVVVTNGQNQVIVTPTGGRVFYRLRQ